MGICNTIVAAGLHLASIHTPSHYQTVETSRPAQSPTAGAQSSTAVSVTRVVDRRYNNVNPGLYARCDSGLQVGGYYNSERNFTGYVAYLKDVKIAGPLSVWGSVGLATGYRRHDVLPIALIGPTLDLGTLAALRVGYGHNLGDGNGQPLVQQSAH